jgi:bacteriocin-like protein
MEKKKIGKIKINKATVKKVMNSKEMNEIEGGYLFSLINGCSHSLCFSSNCQMCATDPLFSCCF